MRYIVAPNPSTIEITDINDEPLRDQMGRPLSAEMTFKQFVMQRLVDPAFVDGKKGADGVLVVVEAKTALKKQSFDSGAVIELEDDHYDRLLKATNEPQSGPYDLRIAHCLAPFIEAIRNVSKTAPVVS